MHGEILTVLQTLSSKITLCNSGSWRNPKDLSSYSTDNLWNNNHRPRVYNVYWYAITAYHGPNATLAGLKHVLTCCCPCTRNGPLARSCWRRLRSRCLLADPMMAAFTPSTNQLNSDDVRSAFHQFPGAGHYSLLVRFYGVLVGSSPTLPSKEVMLILTAYRLFGLRKGGDMLGRSLWPAWRGPKRTVLVYLIIPLTDFLVVLESLLSDVLELQISSCTFPSTERINTISGTTAQCHTLVKQE